jgi:hypothetical protein
MTVEALLTRCRTAGLKVSADGDDLVVRPKEKLTAK